MADSIFESYEPAFWHPDGDVRVYFPVEVIEEGYANRVVGHDRLGREGARQEDTGGKATEWRMTVGWYNSLLHEDGIDGQAQYPDGANAMSAAFKVHTTGTLMVPTVGPRRCKAVSYRRVETRQQGVDLAACTYIWHGDNEDDASQATASLPSAASVARIFVADAIDLSGPSGINVDGLSSLAELAAQLEDLANAPGNFVASIEAKANAMVNQIERVESAFTDAGNQGLDEVAALMTDPAQSVGGRMVRRALDVIRRAPGLKAGGRTVERVFQADLSIFAIATAVTQNAADLVAVNAQLPDVLNIQAGTPVRVFL